MAVNSGPGTVALDERACWTLLRSADVGRLAVSVAGHPDIFPINFVTDHGTIVFRTSDGTKLAAALEQRLVAFEADGYDAAAGEAWSVVIKADAEEIKEIPEALDAMMLPLFPWHAGSKSRFIRIVPLDVSGRRFHVADPAAWRTSMTETHRAAPE